MKRVSRVKTPLPHIRAFNQRNQRVQSPSSWLPAPQSTYPRSRPLSAAGVVLVSKRAGRSESTSGPATRTSIKLLTRCSDRRPEATCSSPEGSVLKPRLSAAQETSEVSTSGCVALQKLAGQPRQRNPQRRGFVSRDTDISREIYRRPPRRGAGGTNIQGRRGRATPTLEHRHVRHENLI